MKVDQCLFGYADGHRLLAASTKLAPEATSELAAISDIAPGVSFGRAGSYWTGFPSPKLGRYVLMRTWPAPEMPRPGCVWTHALLVDPVQFGHIPDLRSLQGLFRRPLGPMDVSPYSVELDEDHWQAKPSNPQSALDEGLAIQVFELLYADGWGPLDVIEPGQADDLVFRVWSQQWPRLRRNFRFRTAASRGAASPIIRFDLQIRLGFRSEPERSLEPWTRAALEDVKSDSPTPLREFIWRYGEDVKRQRGSFRPLVELFLQDKVTPKVPFDPATFLDSFSEPNDARRLKQDLIDGTILNEQQLRVLEFAIENGRQDCLPGLSATGRRRFTTLGAGRLDEIVALAETSLAHPGPVANSVLAAASKALPDDGFWTITRDYPELRRRMIRERPTLMGSAGPTEVSPGAFLDLLDLVPDQFADAEKMISGWTSIDSEAVASTLAAKFPAETASVVVRQMDDGLEVARPWIRVLGGQAEHLLALLPKAHIRRCSTLLALAQAMDWVSAPVLRGGTHPWVEALKVANDDLTSDQTDIFNAFLLALAMASGDKDSTYLIQRCFEPIHSQILDRWLPWTADEILRPYLPNLGWGRNWDLGLRLRLAVASAYVLHALSPESYATLSNDRRVRRMLADAAGELDGGRRYEKALLK